MILQKVYAEEATSGGGAAAREIRDPFDGGLNNLGEVFAMVINIIIGVGWALVFVMLALGFVQYVTSRGEKTAVDAAQKWLTYAVIGGVGLFFISFLKKILPGILGADGTTPVPGSDFLGTF